MNKIVLSILFSFFWILACSNNIDKLSTSKQVEQFIQKLQHETKPTLKLGKMNSIFPNKKIRDNAKKLGLKTWIKRDLNNDGLTDLIAYCIIDGVVNLTVVMATENDYKVHETYIGYSFSNFCFYKLERTNNNIPLLVLYFGTLYGQEPYKIKDSVKLVYRNGDFIEYNPNYQKYSIEKIFLRKSTCDGYCKPYCLYVYPNRNVLFFEFTERDYDYIFEESKFSVVDSASYENIIDLLNYLDFPNYDKKPLRILQGVSFYYLTITYNNGLTKHITTQRQGIFGLNIILDELIAIIKSNDWL
jgi:hypothetical protein